MLLRSHALAALTNPYAADGGAGAEEEYLKPNLPGLLALFNQSEGWTR